ncbi:uncharacterized protein LOC135337848 [Halichondria panicea]|uniref:uncharacterized protein LOC135337848 n=1 Tax=Halichondria panicea TaxID=6063 RepID=UPI00312B69FD
MAGGCHNYTDSDFNIIFTTKLVVSSLATVTCIAATLLILCAKAYKRFVYRLVLYFMIAVMFQAISLILEQTPIIHNKPDSQVEVRNGWDVPCSIFAFLDQIALWIGNFVVLWIFLYLLHLVWNLYHLKLVQQSQKISKGEIIALFAIFILPLTFNWIPFATNMYGLSGLWCWIKETENGCTSDPTIGLVLIFTLFYGPLMFLMVFGFASLLVIVVALCKRWKSVQGLVRQRYTKGIKEIVFVMMYPILYNLICIFLVVNRINSAIRSSRGEPPFYPLWLAHALADSFRTLLPPLAFLLHPSTWGNLMCVKKREEDEDTEYFYVPPEDSDIGEGITIRGTKQIEYGSVLL